MKQITFYSFIDLFIVFENTQGMQQGGGWSLVPVNVKK